MNKVSPTAYPALVGSLTLAAAKSLSGNDVLLHRFLRNADGTPERWRVSGKPKVWKRAPWRVQVPIKRGLREYDHLTEHDLDRYYLER